MYPEDLIQKTNTVTHCHDCGRSNDRVRLELVTQFWYCEACAGIIGNAFRTPKQNRVLPNLDMESLLQRVAESQHGEKNLNKQEESLNRPSEQRTQAREIKYPILEDTRPWDGYPPQSHIDPMGRMKDIRPDLFGSKVCPNLVCRHTIQHDWKYCPNCSTNLTR
jgi:ribosomal protein L37AE/L43A